MSPIRWGGLVSGRSYPTTIMASAVVYVVSTSFYRSCVQYPSVSIGRFVTRQHINYNPYLTERGR